ncbi:MAG: hypothetical protein OIN86_16795 [Candidatus Methanoperedens sp.]|nr:hypothetical protein [Candidatus Methanoperedens sp.]CAG0998669.1 hypothetical protein METP1_02735 [Methanosarcinales archaeon]
MATSIIKYLAAMEANKKSLKIIQSTKGEFIVLDKFKPIDKIQKDDFICVF